MINILFDKIKKYRNPVKYWREKGVKIGEQCEIYSSVDFGSEPYLVQLGNHVRVNSGVTFDTHDGGVWVAKKYLRVDELNDTLALYGAIKIGDNVHIGTNAFIMPGVTVGNNCIIGVGAIVTKSIPSNSVAVGVPAKVIESLDTYIEKHKKEFNHEKYASRTEKKNALIKKHLSPRDLPDSK